MNATMVYGNQIARRENAKRVARQKAKIIAIIKAIIICLVFVVAMKFCAMAQNTVVQAEVISSNGIETIFELPSGHQYSWESEETVYTKGDTYKLTMFDMETVNPYDDVILEVSK